MRNTTDSKMEDDIGDISLEHRAPNEGSQEPEAPALPINHEPSAEHFLKATKSQPDWLREKWVEGKSAREIADETGQDVETIYRMLKELQKALNKANGH